MGSHVEEDVSRSFTLLNAPTAITRISESRARALDALTLCGDADVVRMLTTAASILADAQELLAIRARHPHDYWYGGLNTAKDKDRAR